MIDHGIDKWQQNPGLMAYKLQANSYKFSWLLIPLSVPFVWLLFAWRRRFGAYDHAVFVTYSLCFMSLLFVTIAALGQIPAVPGGPPPENAPPTTDPARGPWSDALSSPPAPR